VLLDSGETDRVLALIDEAEALAGRTTSGWRRTQGGTLLRPLPARRRFERPRRQGGACRGRHRARQPIRQVGYLHKVADLFVDIGDWARARELVDEAQSFLQDVHQAGGDATGSSQQAIKRATLARPRSGLATPPRCSRLSSRRDRHPISRRLSRRGRGAPWAIAPRRAAGLMPWASTTPHPAPDGVLAGQRLLLAADEGRIDWRASGRGAARRRPGADPAGGAPARASAPKPTESPRSVSALFSAGFLS
jgi:hypothetical protein